MLSRSAARFPLRGAVYLVVLSVPLFSGCTSVPPLPTNEARPGMLPPPFSAAEIREAHPVGLVRILEYMATGDGSRRIRASVVEASEEHVTFREEQLLPDGSWSLLQDNEYTWKELEGHASQFPTQSATIELETVEWLGSPTVTWRYTVSNAEQAVEMNLWFAVDQPGPPIRMVQTMGPTTQMSLEQVAVTRP